MNIIQKKYAYLTVLWALWGFGCQNQPINESMATTDKSASVLTAENIEAFAAVPLNVAAICNPAAGQECLVKTRQLRLELVSKNIIPVPKEGKKASLSVEQATTRYKEFVAAHKGEPIVSVFRQVYARALLTRYGVLEGNDYELIMFYTKELADENSLDFSTLTSAAIVLKDKMPQRDYVALVNTTAERALEQEKMLQKRIGALKLIATQKTTKGQQTSEAVAADMMMSSINESMKQSSVTKLARLQESVRQENR